MAESTRRDDEEQQQPEVTIIGPVGRTVRMPEGRVVMVPCPYGTIGQQCRSCPLTTGLPCVVREMVGATDETTRRLLRRLLGER